MNTIFIKQGYGYLKDYEFHLATDEDILQIENNELKSALMPIPLLRRHLMTNGFELCHDNFGRGDYFKYMGLNIWWSKHRHSYYYTCRRFIFYMHFFHSFQYFLETYLHLEIIDFTEISLYIDNYYRYANNRNKLRLYYTSIGIDPIACFNYQCETKNKQF